MPIYLAWFYSCTNITILRKVTHISYIFKGEYSKVIRISSSILTSTHVIIWMASFFQSIFYKFTKPLANKNVSLILVDEETFCCCTGATPFVGFVAVALCCWDNVPRFWLVFAAFDLFKLWIIVSTFSNAYCNLVASCSLQPCFSINSNENVLCCR